jgi:tRNA U34 5-carboxymethylaminomethyl modifying enzyme MnmG/GidA
MSCNPAIGGQAKDIVKEILAAKGKILMPPVFSPDSQYAQGTVRASRAQADSSCSLDEERAENQEHLDLKQARLHLVVDDEVVGVRDASRRQISRQNRILTTGTFRRVDTSARPSRWPGRRSPLSGCPITYGSLALKSVD